MWYLGFATGCHHPSFDTPSLQQRVWPSRTQSTLKPGLYSRRAYMRAHAPTVGAAVYISVTNCAQRIRTHTLTVAVKVQTYWTFKASADQRWHSSQSRKRPEVTEGRHVVLHRNVCGRIPTHTLACLNFYTRRNLHYAVATRRQTQAWTFASAAGPYERMEYKPGLILTAELCCAVCILL